MSHTAASPECQPRCATQAPARRLYVDWLRGIAVLLMILWHAIDSWTVTTAAVRTSNTFAVVGFLAGWAAPLFLFLAGVSLPLAGAARMARGHTRRAASALLQRRGWQVFLIAHLFRLQSFLLDLNGTWNGLLKPDILNILGLSIVYASFAWGRADTRRQLAFWLLVPALVVVALVTPLAPTWWWPSLLHPRIEGYIRVVNNNAVFSLFPASAYLMVGAFFGALLSEHEQDDPSLQRRTALWGGTLFVVSGGVVGVVAAFGAVASGGAAIADWRQSVGFWIGPMAIVIWRVGTMLLLLVGSWRMLRGRRTSATSPLIVFGRTSLFVYMVHVELAYSNVSYPLHHALTLPWALTAYVCLTLLMLAAARLWLGRVPGPLIPAHMRGGREARSSQYARRPALRSPGLRVGALFEES